MSIENAVPKANAAKLVAVAVVRKTRAVVAIVVVSVMMGNQRAFRPNGLLPLIPAPQLIMSRVVATLIDLDQCVPLMVSTLIILRVVGLVGLELQDMAKIASTTVMAAP